MLPLRGGALAVVVFADDPRRTEAALDLWQKPSQQTLWILGSSPLQLATQRQLQRRGLNNNHPRLMALLDGEDTVGQATALATRLPNEVGRVLLVTDQAHRNRALAVSRYALGTYGIEVSAPPIHQLPTALSQEKTLRLYRDVLRVHLWRLCGWDGRAVGLWLRQYQG